MSEKVLPVKQAIEEIKAIIERHGVGGTVVLNDGTQTEFLNKVELPWNALFMDDTPGGVGIRIRTTGITSAADKKLALERSINLMESLRDQAANTFLVMDTCLRTLKHHGVEWDDCPVTYHKERGN